MKMISKNNLAARVNLSACFACLLLLVVSGGWNPVLSADAQQSNQVQAVDLYHQAWQLIHDRYFDPAYNSQDWNRWKHKYDNRIKDFEDSHKALETMFASLADSYTSYRVLSHEIDQLGPLFGVGILIQRRGQLLVAETIDGSSAAKAGVMPNDIIVAIDGQPAVGLSVDQAVARICGSSVGTVKLCIGRENELIEYILQRGQLSIRAVNTAMMLNNEVGYIRIGHLIAHQVKEEMKEALTKVKDARGIVIDLRDCPGGLPETAVDLCSMFVDKGVIFSTIDRNGKVISTYTSGHRLNEQQIVVLINERTVGIAEIISGALQDSHRAELVGWRSFGKGLVPGIQRLQYDGAVNFYRARYLTANQTEINRAGVRPNYEVEVNAQAFKEGYGPWFLYRPDKETNVTRSPIDGIDIQLAKAVEVLKKKLESSS
jgi:carboxyl-terminal processing protease